PLLSVELKPNRKTLGPKLGPRLQEVCTAIEAFRVSGELKFPLELTTPGGPVGLEAADAIVTYKAAAGWAGAADRGTQVAIDTRITPDLKRAGLAREIVRFVQDLRKTAGLQMEDRIYLALITESATIRQAIDAHRDYVAAETLGVSNSTAPLDGAAARS